jgi:hypothetical protein
VATVVVVLVVGGTLVALRPDRWLASPGSTPTELATGRPAATEAGGSTVAWRALAIAPLAGGPIGARSVVGWRGGYLALAAAGADGTCPAWTSTDGRAWVPLPSGTFGQVRTAAAVAALDGLVVVVERADGSVDAYRSADGEAWARTMAPALATTPDGSLAGTPGGLLGVVGGDPGRLAFSADGITWQVSSPPGLNRSNVSAVAALGAISVALGSEFLPVVEGSGAGAPGRAVREVAAAWWSTDGLVWHDAAMSGLLIGPFAGAWAGSAGLVALSGRPGGGERRTYWRSSDGRSWAISDADPLGAVADAGGADGGSADGGSAGGVLGSFAGDGHRLLVSGRRAEGRPVEYWTSPDAATWARLEVSGTADVVAAVSGATPFLLRDGVLFANGSGTWLGLASP